MLNIPTSYDVLGVSPTASDSDIKLAYRRLVSEWHPDARIHDPSFADRNLKIINEAYSNIKTHAARKQYNQVIALQRKAAALSHTKPNSWARFWNWLTQLESKAI